MERKKISASNIRSVGYEPASQTLEVEFSNGAVCQYSRVSQDLYRRFMNATSPGSFFKDNIEEDYSAKRVR
ncbi:MAG: KTSC domain-containing protein [Betaproteobacteria bacterium]|nr:KTSC domain-containing protein [Betaproteobacteria bacterium]